MTMEQFDVSYRACSRRRPFQPFLIEFMSGQQFLISHPEAIDVKLHVYVMRGPKGGHVIFAAEGVARLLDSSMAEK
jgi:hypothetical protein